MPCRAAPLRSAPLRSVPRVRSLHYFHMPTPRRASPAENANATARRRCRPPRYTWLSNRYIESKSFVLPALLFFSLDMLSRIVTNSRTNASPFSYVYSVLYTVRRFCLDVRRFIVRDGHKFISLFPLIFLWQGSYDFLRRYDTYASCILVTVFAHANAT